MANEAELLALLERNGINYERIEHVPLFTTKQAEEVMGHVPGIPSKNLFLESDTGKLFLISTTDKKRVDLKTAAATLGVKKLSFGKPEQLKSALGVDPGAVTLFGAVNDPEHRVRVLIDKDIINGDRVQCHPLINTVTLLIPVKELLRFFQVINHPYEPYLVPEKLNA